MKLLGISSTASHEIEHVMLDGEENNHQTCVSQCQVPIRSKLQHLSSVCSLR